MTNDTLRLVRRPTCSALVITCSDFRFKTVERDFALALDLLDDYDLIARPGAIRSLVAPRSPAAETTMVEEIRMLWTAHAFTRIIALHHLSCRAYADIATDQNERDVHLDHLHRARPILDGYFAAATAETYLADVTPDGIEVISTE